VHHQIKGAEEGHKKASPRQTLDKKKEPKKKRKAGGGKDLTKGKEIKKCLREKYHFVDKGRKEPRNLSKKKKDGGDPYIIYTPKK